MVREGGGQLRLLLETFNILFLTRVRITRILSKDDFFRRNGPSFLIEPSFNMDQCEARSGNSSISLFGQFPFPSSFSHQPSPSSSSFISSSAGSLVESLVESLMSCLAGSLLCRMYTVELYTIVINHFYFQRSPSILLTFGKKQGN